MLPTPGLPTQDEARTLIGSLASRIASVFVSAHESALTFFTDSGRPVNTSLLPYLVRYHFQEGLRVLDISGDISLQPSLRLSVAFDLADMHIRLYKMPRTGEMRRAGSSKSKMRIIEQDELRRRRDQPELTDLESPSHAGTGLVLAYEQDFRSELVGLSLRAYDGYLPATNDEPNPRAYRAWAWELDLDSVIAENASGFTSEDPEAEFVVELENEESPSDAKER